MNILRQLYLTSDYHDKFGMIFNTDCMEFMSNIKQGGYLMLRLPIFLMIWLIAQIMDYVTLINLMQIF